MEYIKDKEYMDIVADIIDSEIFQSMDRYIQHGNTTCKAHCIDVSYMTYTICKRAGLRYKEAARAALLHDFFLYDWHTYYEESGNRFHGFTHPRVAMNNAKKYFHIGKLEADMILKHMWPLTIIPPFSAEGFVLVYTDKVCSGVEVTKEVWKSISGIVGV